MYSLDLSKALRSKILPILAYSLLFLQAQSTILIGSACQEPYGHASIRLVASNADSLWVVTQSFLI